MKIDISKNLEAVAPWDLTLSWDGVDYPTVRPTLGLVGRFQAMEGQKIEEAIDLVAEIFAEPRPKLAEWPGDAIYAVMSAYVSHFNNTAKKNSQGIKAAMEVATATTMPTADSTSP